MRMDPPPTGRDAYYAEADTWARDIQGSLRRSTRLAWTVAGCACAVALLQAIALFALVPLKSIVPYTITVDRQTGYIETARGLKPGPLSQDVAVTHAFLAQYVLARETFDPADLQANYRKVAQWTAGAARGQYIRAMALSNPQSPSRLNPPGAIVQTTIKSISLLSPTTALVRFQTERLDGGADAGEVRPYAAVVAFRYTGAPMKMGDRLVNPLGFQVTGYRRDSEAVDLVASGAGAATPANAASAPALTR